MIHRPALIASLLAGFVLSACGNLENRSGRQFAELWPDVQRLISEAREPTQPLRPTAGFPGLDPATIRGLTVPLMGAYLERRQALAGLAVAEATPNGVSWRTADNVGLTLSGTGMLLATRGLGADLHAADSRQTAALIAAGRGGAAERRHVYLDGNYRPVTVVLSCTIQPAGAETLVLNGRSLRTLRLDETCTGDGGLTITNRYWRDAGGPLIRQSSQWVGPDVGTIHLQRLIE